MAGRHLLLPAMVAAASLFAPPSASAGSYSVVACADDPTGANRSWVAGSTSSLLPAYSEGCRRSPASGLVARAAALSQGGTAPNGGLAYWEFVAPTGAAISRVELSARAFRFGGSGSDYWGVGLSDEGDHFYLGDLGEGQLDVGSAGAYVTYSVPSRQRLRLGIRCADAAGCSVRPTNDPALGSSRARVDLFGARVRVTDSSVPMLSNQAGSLLTSDQWLSGIQSLSFTGSDNVGVALAYSEVGDQRKETRSTCDYTLTVPCPSPTQQSAVVDTRTIPDGDQLVRIGAVDTGGNLATVSHRALIDNTPPSAPSRPALQGVPSSEWRAVNSFTLTYANPPVGGGAPLMSHDIEICELDAAGRPIAQGCTVDARSGAPQADIVIVPTRGRFRARVRVNDVLFTGAWSDWSPDLRFDDTVPGTPVVSYPNGWINGALADGTLELGPPASPGSALPSGIVEYRVRVDGGSERIVPAVPATGAGAFRYADLEEGSHTIAVKAVSGAGVETPTLFASDGIVRKDTVPPRLGVAGAPAEGAFVRYAVEFRLRAADSVSGMAPAVPPAPVSSGGFVSSQVDLAPAVVHAGADATVSPGDGEHYVQVFASDVAGNRSDPQAFAYTQDTAPPAGGLRPIVADHPALLDFHVDEDCLVDPSVQISTVSGVWRRLDTTSGHGQLTALVPSDVWLPRAAYTVRAEVEDCAGNHGVLDRWYGGARNGLPIGLIVPPPREAVRAVASLTPEPRHHSASASRSRRIRARLVDVAGRPLAGLVVRFETQPRVTSAVWATAASARTDAKGYASTAIAPHSSLRIRAVAPGSELRDEAVSNLVYLTRAASTSIGARPKTVRPHHRVRLSGRLRGG
ncbi:MAG: hypothetical protein F2813_04610, partial [Actinobacteria bacterium]|nr:hypothetical protein [Actinomycetota bacterium]